jgi:photosystem II stability/assembly factor-like uncharacterized protein
MRKIILLVLVFFAAAGTAIVVKNKTIAISSKKSPHLGSREDSHTDEPLQFFKFHEGIRKASDESKPSYKAGYKINEYQKALTAALKARNSSPEARTEDANGVIEFKERGPGNVPGRTRSLLVLPSDVSKKTWLAGAATGGIWKTTDGGTSWSEKSAKFPVLPISSLAMSEVNNNIIYAGTGELVSSIYSAIGDGIFKSSDQGETWSQLSSTASNPDFSIVTRIIVDPKNPNILLATTSKSSLSTDDSSLILRSTNGGETWNKVYEAFRDIEQIIFTPDNFSIQYASINEVGVIKSTDAGLTWFLSNKGQAPAGRLEIAVSPVDPKRLFASSEGTTGALSKTGADLYKSDNSGESWELVDVKFNNVAIDFLEGQGFYDNTIACDPYNKDIVYVGGVSHFRVTLGTGSTTVDNYSTERGNTTGFLLLNAFNNATFFDSGRLQVGSSANKRKVEIRFGSGKSQKAHRFFVPDKKTSGVATAEYTFQDLMDIPFEAWDVSTSPERQLAVSFRDQNRNGFDLLPVVLTATSSTTTTESAFLDSREYVYIHDLDYSTSANSLLSINGGQEVQLVYAFFPASANQTTWNSLNLPSQNTSLTIQYSAITKSNASTITVSDSRGSFDDKNTGNQVNLTIGVHADHHFTVILPHDINAKTYQVLLTTDGGVFASNISTNPGIVEGDWQFKGFGFNTSQFYGADKKPGFEEYIGGMQDNGTRRSSAGEIATAKSNFIYAIGGDGFEVSWNSVDGKKVIGSIYNNIFFRSIDGGDSWSPAFSGFPLVSGVPDPSKYPFISKIGSSRSLPDELYAVGTDGVWKSVNFGSSWSLTPIIQNWGSSPTFFDVEVSRANANIVWAGSGMSDSRKLHVSRDGGKTYSPTSNFASTLGSITKLASHPTEPNTAYALFSFANRPKILRTLDLGNTWQDISGFGSSSTSSNGFPNVAVYCLYVRPDNANIIWAGTEIGIVESLDGGNSWNLLNDSRIPNVSIWDMKGQDDEIVIATHGRGIWTAKINASQTIESRPTIITAGTSPQSNYVLQFNLPINYDAVDVVINGKTLTTLKDQPSGTYNLTVSNLSAGVITSQLVAYKGESPVQSATFVKNKLDIVAPVGLYVNRFDINSTDFVSFNNDSNQPTFAVISLSGSSNNTSLQTAHNYPLKTELTSILVKPIIVSADNPNLFYSEVALVANDGDYVTIEGTKDGITWKPLISNYNASANTTWTNAVNSGGIGTDEMQISRSVKLTPTFATNDVILIRFRLSSNATGTAWGWSIDDLYIQQTPTGLEDLLPSNNKLGLGVYPNPAATKTNARIFYTLNNEGEVKLTVSDLNGKIIADTSLGLKEKGYHEETIPVSLDPAIYFIKIKTLDGIAIKRLLVTD